eukprot:TRINITY_DN1017_c0_g1_i2.p2 TRINITY_DN1017_c0_g1~~TRINITY_DN1017_c0_g1_i2.p2  ORF type:complete len:159 (+),score=15.29 TRINITY_DN1017_c0_g1_i2:691-1167(+)
MPVCSFYLKGICNKEDCPYSHIYVSPDTALCPDFLKGHCEAGRSCKLRHSLDIHESKKKSKDNSKSPTKTVTRSEENTIKKREDSEDVILLPSCTTEDKTTTNLHSTSLSPRTSIMPSFVRQPDSTLKSLFLSNSPTKQDHFLGVDQLLGKSIRPKFS